MKFSIFLITLVVLTAISTVSTADLKQMDSQHPAFTQNISPEHLPGSNMIGAGRGRRVQQWKSTQAANEGNHQPQPSQPPQQSPNTQN